MSLIDVDNVDTFAWPAQRDRAPGQVVLAGGGLGVVGDLVERGLADVEVGVTLQARRGDLPADVVDWMDSMLTKTIPSVLPSGPGAWTWTSGAGWVAGMGSVICARTFTTAAVVTAGSNDAQAELEGSPPPWWRAGRDWVMVDRGSPACDVVVEFAAPGVDPGALREAHVTIHQAIPRAASTPRPWRHPSPGPPAAIWRNSS